MSKATRTIALCAVALSASLSAQAQSAAATPAAQPTAAAYDSAFEGYRPFASEEVGNWRQANDTVRDIGGWRAYAREIQGATRSPAPPAAAPTAPAVPSAPSAPARPGVSHQGHQR